MSKNKGTFTKSYMLETEIRQKIDHGIWKIGDKIPSETEMMRQYNVSRTLVRNVLAKLQQDGLLHSRQGAGTFVAQSKLHIQSPFENRIRDQLDSIGYSSQIKILDFFETTASPRIAEYLKITDSPSIFVFRQLRFVNNQPFSISTSFIPKTIFSDFGTCNIQCVPVSQLLDTNYGYSCSAAREFLEAIPASEDTCNLLLVKKDSPLLSLEHISYNSDGVPFELNHILFRGDRIRLHFNYNMANIQP